MFNQTVKDEIAKIGGYMKQTARLMVGVPDYENYVRCFKTKHPNETPMTYEAFVRERQDIRGSGEPGRRPGCS